MKNKNKENIVININLKKYKTKEIEYKNNNYMLKIFIQRKKTKNLKKILKKKNLKNKK